MTKAAAFEFTVKNEPWVRYKLEDGTLLFWQVDYSKDFQVRRLRLLGEPFCVLMSRVKVSMLDVDIDKLDEYCKDIPSLHDRYEKKDAVKDLLDFYESENAIPVKVSLDEKFDELFLLAYLDAMGYARRRANQSVEKLFPVVVHRYLQAVRNFASVRDELGLELGRADVRIGDARRLDLEDDSVDGSSRLRPIPLQ